MEYTLRKIEAKDVFLVTTIISKLGVKEIKNCFQGEETTNLIKQISNNKDNQDAALNAIGISVIIDIASVVLENMEKCQDKIFQLLSNLSGMKVEEIEKLNGAVLFEMIIEVIKDNTKDFIGVASRLFNLGK